METDSGVKLTKKQIKNINDFEKLMKEWDKNLCINAIAGKLHIMLLGDTKQNPTPELSDTGGFNPDNCIVDFPKITADGGDW
ncbi:hypothetical protein SL057_002386 [Flavobacterium psychrophilum]|nr:hypothetical protein [Flavobacterium psychrophilum]